MAAGYETFVHDLADLREGRRTILVLRDLTPGRRKYFAQHIVGVVGRGPSADDEARPLTVRSAAGNRFPGEWHVRIVEVLPSRAPGAPYQDAYAAMTAAWGEAGDR
jgi:hypothetical protein